MLSDTDNILSCQLRYTDSFHLLDGDDPQQLISIAPIIPERLEKELINPPAYEITVKGTALSTRLTIKCVQKNLRLLLIFNATCDEKLKKKDVYDWFNSAREDIHILFDTVVSDSLRQRLK